MKITSEVLDLIKRYEGLILNAYKDPAGVYTIGYGHTKGVKKGQIITKEQAEALLIEDIAAFERHVDKYDSIFPRTIYSSISVVDASVYMGQRLVCIFDWFVVWTSSYVRTRVA